MGGPVQQGHRALPAQGDSATILEDTSHDLRGTCTLCCSRRWYCVPVAANEGARHIAVAVVIPGLIGAGAVLGPGGPGLSLVRGEPTASPVSHARFRDEERSTVEAAPNPTQSITVSSAPPARSEQTPAFTALTGLPTAEEAMRATHIAQEKIKVEREKRARARTCSCEGDRRPQAGPVSRPAHTVRLFLRTTSNVWAVQERRGWNAREILLKKSEADH